MNKNRFLAPAILIAILFISGIASPLLIKNRKENWGKILNQKIQLSENAVKNLFDEKASGLIEYKNSLSKEIVKQLKAGNNSSSKNFIPSFDDENYSVSLYGPGKNLVYWSGKEILFETDIHEFERNIGQYFFHTNKLVTFLSVFDTIKFNETTYSILLGTPLERQFQPARASEHVKNFSSYISEKLSTSVKIFFDPKSKIMRDGRIHSFELTNNFGNKIGIVDFEKPALDNDVYEMENLFSSIQSVILILIFLSIVWVVFPKVIKAKKTIRFISYAVFAAVLRLLLFYASFPSSFFNSELTNASNFSSTFAFGMVRSPLEFALTAVLAFGVILIGFKFYLEYLDLREKENKSWIAFLFVLLPGILLILLTLRGLGASLRSVVFDSSIRYFKEFNLIPDASTFIMDFNILVVGFGVFLFCLILLLFINSFAPALAKGKKKLLFVALFLFVQLSGAVFDIVQKQPQGTPLIRVLFITVLFVLGYLLIFKNYRSAVKYLYIAFGASIATVSLLTYYNSEIERESLKTTAQDLTRSNESIYRFMVYQTLTSIQNDPQVINALLQKENLSPVALVSWTKSLLYHETLPAVFSFYDPELNKSGSFSTSAFNNSFVLIPEAKVNLEIPDVRTMPAVFGGKLIIYGSVVVKNNNEIIGYASVAVIYDESYFNFVNVPDFLLVEKSGISSALNIERLKIFYFHNGILERSFGSVQLSDEDGAKIINHKFSKHNEAWLNLNIAGEKYLFYLLNVDGNKSKILAVAKEEKNYTWNLSDFFKVFFVHTIIILIAFVFLAAWNYRKLLIFMSSYKTKLAAAFVIVSVVPLILIAVYFKNITEVKNSELISNRLEETAGQILNYLNGYLSKSTVNPELIFEKAAADLAINFSIFKNKQIYFSSNIDYYNAGLLPEIIPMNVWYDLYSYGLEKSFFRPGPNGSNYTVFLKSNYGNENYIIKVDNRFNGASYPLSDIEIDIFMFGIFSLAIIMLIVFSTILAEQISAPIRKLTNATRSLGSGDLNIEVTGNFSGEIAELTSGFNMMVKRLRKSQIEMAQLERETAWKEMAKQVAHEIKNPLTPMKLSVQQLIAAYKDKSPKFDAIFEKVTSTVIAQIETLKNIASEFSNFARMPKLNIEKINLVDSIRETINLFLNEKLQIKFSYGETQIFINADHDHLNRTLINLVRNSIQASAKNIFIDVSTEKNICLVRVADDGFGIEKQNIEKVFDDKFTTKSGGMGLGLSMAKKFLESMNGNILVEKTSEEGTVFLITIPLSG